LGVFLTVDLKQALSVDWQGLCCMAVAIVSSALYRVRMEDVTAQFKPILVSTYLFLIMALFTAAFVMPFAGPIPSYALPIGAWIGFAAALANVAFLMALARLGSTRVSIINMLQRPLIAVAAAFILKEPLTIMQIVGIVLVFAGVQMASVKRKRNEQSIAQDLPTDAQSLQATGRL
jgi:drug/metabolite transporter (DMT)-like permease